MLLFLVRHGQSSANLNGVYSGQTDVPLTELGRQQAMAIRPILEKIPFDRVYSSDLCRAQQTAREIFPHLDPICTRQLREICVGTISGMSLAECISRYGQQYLDCERQQDFAPFGGETQREMQTRIREFIQQLEQESGAEHIAVVGHEGTVHQFLCHALGHPIPLEHFHIENASVTLLEYGGGNWRLLSFGQGGLSRV